MRTALLLILVCFAFSRPSSYDVRSQQPLTLYADYSLQPEGICVGYAFAKELAQIFSNVFSLATKQKEAFSAQQILDCSKFMTPVCHKVTLDHITAALTFIEKTGLTTNTCYLNTPVEDPSTCRRNCNNGYSFPRISRARPIEYSSVEDLLKRFEDNENTAGFVVLKVYDSMNYFSAEIPSDLTPVGEFYEYRVAEVVGWKKSGQQVILRIGFGEGWGFNGYATLSSTSPLIVKTYELQLLENQAEQ